MTISTEKDRISVLRNIKSICKMNFTSDIKKEIISRGMGRGSVGAVEKKAALSAFVRTSGFLGEKDGSPNFFIVSETENVAEFFMTAFSDVFNAELSVTRATMDRMSGRDKLLLQCPQGQAAEVMKQLALVKRTGGIRYGISASLTSTEQTKIAYVKGAFLGGGSCTVPTDGAKTGYHLEIVFSDRQTARDFCDLLADLEIIARLLERKETFVVYIKSKEIISDFLSMTGVKNALRKFSALVEKRDQANHDNRAQNCMAGNADKTAIAAVKQVVAITRLKNQSGYEELSEELKELAELRLQFPTMSLQELADTLKVSKSCLNHRMRKLMQLAEKCE